MLSITITKQVCMGKEKKKKRLYGGISYISWVCSSCQGTSKPSGFALHSIKGFHYPLFVHLLLTQSRHLAHSHCIWERPWATWLSAGCVHLTSHLLLQKELLGLFQEGYQAAHLPWQRAPISVDPCRPCELECTPKENAAFPSGSFNSPRPVPGHSPECKEYE